MDSGLNGETRSAFVMSNGLHKMMYLLITGLKVNPVILFNTYRLFRGLFEDALVNVLD